MRVVFALAAGGAICSGIARALTEARLTRRNGKLWTPRQVAAVLGRRRFYEEGVLRYGEARGQNKRLALLEERGQ